MKDSFYFPHDFNARSDEKILNVRIKYGMEGYGIYFAILEKLRENTDYKCVKDYNAIAFDLRVDASKIKDIVENFGLFICADDGSYFYSESFNKRMIPLDNLREQRRNAGLISAEKRLNSTTVQRPLKDNPTTVEKKSNKESKVNESKVKKSIKENSPNGESKKDELSLPDEKRIDFIGLMNFFNQTFSGKLPEIKTIDEKRKAAIRARVATYGKQAVYDVLQAVAKSDFLLGNNDRNWRCDFDWIFKPTNFTKILEGNYSRDSNNLTAQDKLNNIINKLNNK